MKDIETELLLVGQSKGKFGGGQRRVFKQTQKKTREGNKPSFSTFAVVGNHNGYVGLGSGKSKETVPARDKSKRKAKGKSKKKYKNLDVNSDELGEETKDEIAEPSKEAPKKEKKKKKRGAQPWMFFRAELSGLIRKKEGIPGGRDGFKKTAELVNKAIEDAHDGVSWAKLKEQGKKYDDVMKKALEHYKKN